MKRLPIRWRFALWAAVLVGIVLLVHSAGTLLNLYQEQIEAVDLALESETRFFAKLTEDEIRQQPLEVLLRYQPWTALAVFDETGNLIRRSPRLPEELARSAVTRPGVHTARAKLEAWRLQAFRQGRLTVVVAQVLEEVNDIMRDLMFSYALSLPLVLIVSAIGGWWIAGRALQPLRMLTTAAESIRLDSPGWRVPVDSQSAHDEIKRLTDVLNATLTQIEKSFQQSQRFAADASHELRTPLTIMHGEIDRLIHFPGLDSAAAEKLVSLQEEIHRLDRITEHLLLLARFDSGGAVMHRERVNLSKLVADACEDAELLSSAQQLTLRSSVPPNVFVTGDASHLRRAVLALLDNAVRYNHANGEVACALDRNGSRAAIRVRNTGPGIPADARGQLFQRFFRIDSARGRGGHGLGLSLAREIVRAHGGEVSLADSISPEFTEFILTLPLEP